MPESTRTVHFRHLPEYRVLLCTSCSYCVLPNALDRHLKDIHRLTRRERTRLLEELLGLDLAEHGDVLYPLPQNEPILGLPVHDGLACSVEGCNHLCITVKRMQAHWRTEHTHNPSKSKRALVAPGCLPVKLQTFFKGSFLRYFVVSVVPASPVDTSSSMATSSSALSPILFRGPSPTDQNESPIDWWLTGHFFDNSYQSFLPLIGSDVTWREKLLQVAQLSSYLRYAVLSMTASHVAYTHPECRAFYKDEASRYHQLSLRAISRQVQVVNEENFYAVFNFSRLMNLCCIAAVQLPRLDNTLTSDQDTVSLPVVPPWIRSQHLGSAIIAPYADGGRMMQAMHGRPHHRLPDPDLRTNPFDHILAALAVQLASLPVHGDAEDDTVNPSAPQEPSQLNTVLQALRSLRSLWSVPYQTFTSGLRDAALMWTARASPDFLALLAAHHPPALVVFAHYCVLWNLAEERYWYMRGHAEAMLRAIGRELGWEWQSWIAWPWAMILGAEEREEYEGLMEELGELGDVCNVGMEDEVFGWGGAEEEGNIMTQT